MDRWDDLIDVRPVRHDPDRARAAILALVRLSIAAERRRAACARQAADTPKHDAIALDFGVGHAMMQGV